MSLQKLGPHVRVSNTKCAFPAWLLGARAAYPQPSQTHRFHGEQPAGPWREVSTKPRASKHRRERSWFWPARPATADKYLLMARAGEPESPLLGTKAQPQVCSNGSGLQSPFLGQDVGLVGLSPQQDSIIIQSFSPKRAGSESRWGETGGGPWVL